MSALIVSHDLHIMMLELSVEKLYVPRTSVFDSALMKKTSVMFRMLDDEWTALYPHRSDYRRYRGSNYESEPFYGGKSVVFSIPEASLQKKMENVDLQMHISKDVSRYFEMHPSQNIGFFTVKLDKLFNGIIKELKERKELAPHLNFHEREPIARSMKGTFSVLNENSEETESKIDLYIRISYFGKSIITEIMTPETIAKAFYVQEETNEMHPYQCRELKPEELEGGCWGSVTFLPPAKSQNLKCDCENEKTKKLLEMQIKDGNEKGNVLTMDADSFDRRKDDDSAKDKGKEKEEGKGKGKKKEKGKGKGKDKSKVSDEDKDDRIRNDNTGMSDFSADEKDKEEDKGGGEKKKGKLGKGKKENEDEKVKEDLGFIDGKKDKPAKGKGKDGEGNRQEEDREQKREENKGRGMEDKKRGKEGKGKRKGREVKEDGKNQREEDKGRGTKDKGENEDNQKKDKGKQKADVILIDSEKIRRLRRRNAGPCTIGIPEKKPLPCVSAPFSCKICFSNPELTPCLLKHCQIPCFPLNCLQTHFCQETSTLGCC